MNQKRIFITGTNTDVGKTFIAKNILSLLVKRNKSVSIFKPIETGCTETSGYLQPSDSSIFYKILKKNIELDLINPYRFKPAISPNRAIQLARKKVYISNFIKKAKLHSQFDYLIIEGAGGLCSPLALDGLNVDFAKKMKLNCVLIAKDELGVINNVLLSINTLKKYNCCLKAIVLNRMCKTQPKGMNNLEELKCYTKIPIIQVLKNNLKEKDLKRLSKISLGC